ncbi:hypothetical protein [Leifsonia sp. PS1209]|uniref:hypothetical protein n=1 Tax=Leifsonia sp. PS1209 TaxID=2724914 RepID=UPI001442A7DB|nr:hypothetical protein [Leifsonia sp. PS1209]QIZ97789.1 hypothetical protein HF024_04130 [Leifsonia sp. PS1209]
MTDDIPLDELVASLPDTWDDQAPRRTPGMLGIAVINWRTLDDADAPQVWAELRDWVTWFTHRYNLPIRKIPPCWYKHGALVEELSALRTAWLVSFDSLDAGYGPIGWHERLAVAIPRLATWYNGECHNGHTELQQIGHDAVPSGWADWISQSHSQP